MDFRSHRTLEQPVEAVQAGSQTWWTENPMTYDWHGTNRTAPMSREWFDEMDRRFITDSFPYLSKQRPFDRIMPDSLAGARVLEIGCGMGLHTEELLARGAQVTAVDLTELAVQATRTRLRLKGLKARVVQTDAEELPFAAGEFDLVWSWGVIHLSARTARIVRQIARVLSASGEARVMTYNREGLIPRLLLLRHYLLGGGFRRRSPDEVLWEHSDGFTARFYHREQVNDLFRAFFDDVHTSISGQDSDVVPLPGRLRRRVLRHVGDDRRLAAAGRRGMFLFTVARRPS